MERLIEIAKKYQVFVWVSRDKRKSEIRFRHFGTHCITLENNYGPIPESIVAEKVAMIIRRNFQNPYGAADFIQEMRGL